MLYLHCGWPRTSTSGLQEVLFNRRDRLAEVGIDYPEKWRVPTGYSMIHGGILEMVKAFAHSDDAFDELRAYLAKPAARHVLLSAETLTHWLLSEDKLAAFMAMLDAAREVMPTRCIWTLRRLDDAVNSLYMRARAVDESWPPPLAERLEGVGQAKLLFTGMRRVADALGGEAAFVKYDRSGGHNAELLSLFGVPAGVAGEIIGDMKSRRRVNASLSHKQAIVLVHLDELSARAGVQLDRSLLKRALFDGDLTFVDDRRCELVGGDVRRGLLAAARAEGFSPYVDFFDGEEVGDLPPVSLNSSLITDDDLTRVVEIHDSRAETPV